MRMAISENVWIKKLLIILPVIFITSVILIIVGISLLATKDRVVTIEHVVDYTNCISTNFDIDTEVTCPEYLARHEFCVCFEDFNLTDSLQGNVIISYELEDFDQQKMEYASSRDDEQLKGILSPTPSENCEPYRYATTDQGQKPIAPCGAIADSMFTDLYVLTNDDTKKQVPLMQTGILSDTDKQGYRNPNNFGDLKNFSRPLSFINLTSYIDIWNLDPSNPDNNLFQNERFIVWMKTEWKRKPWGRVNSSDYPNGLPSGKYSMRINYDYPPSRYNGTRKFILSATNTISIQSFYVLGILALVIGIILLIASIALFYIGHKSRIKSGHDSDDTTPNKRTEEERALSS